MCGECYTANEVLADIADADDRRPTIMDPDHLHQPVEEVLPLGVIVFSKPRTLCARDSGFTLCALSASNMVLVQQ
jgi:hypothetical protein